MNRRKKIATRLMIAAAASGVLLFFLLAPAIDTLLNRVIDHPALQLSPEAIALHKKILIADLHADCLLWNRDLLVRHSRGHADLPRLQDGNLAVQAFTVVTQMPPVFDLDNNDGSPDLITALAVAQRWPMSSWRSLRARALYQARKLHRFAERADGKLVLIKSSEDLSVFLQRRREDADLVGGFLGLEGAHALEDNLANLDTLFDAGFRMIAPTHFFDNAFGGSAHGITKKGLTGLGKEMIRRMEAKRMIVDLAHASPQLIDEVTAMATRPVLISHTGVNGTCNNARNVNDDAIRRVAGTGGIIGIGYWETATCGNEARSTARAIRYVTDLVGVAHVGLGSDFDGAVAQPFDASGLPQLTAALLGEGFDEDEVAKIMGGNVLRVLQENLP